MFAFRILSNVTFTNGEVNATDGINSYAFIVGNSTTAGTLTITSGSYRGITSVISITNGKAIISGGEFYILYPSDAHEPHQTHGQPSAYRAAVVKVPV